MLVKQRMCRGTNDAGIYYLANCKGMQRCIHLCTVCFVDSFKLETIISPSHDILKKEKVEMDRSHPKETG